MPNDLGVLYGHKVNQTDPIRAIEGGHHFDEDDFLVLALLQDPVYASELLWRDPSNREYGGCYRVRDYQYPLFRIPDPYAGAPGSRRSSRAPR